ncbi:MULTISPECIES: ATP-binding protein [unclassified Legionella]|uniref:ATP-binding protein n=1 Tax=unclassified Legionella TaxID=2622702 RepID=UPI00105509BB|nr:MULTISPECIES: ATP-binding protein [unclassified Legionella]MDI9819034.1 ATP-binding protein [Legionella sp. PL877]
MQPQVLSEIQQYIEDIANQLCLAVKGDFDFTIKVRAENESIQKLTMLINFVLDNARRSIVEIGEKNASLIELGQLKSDFIANISHELRTPLTLILGPLKTILEDPQSLPDELRENLFRIQRNAARLYILVNNILDSSKLEAGKFGIQEEPINLNELIVQLVDDMKDLAEKRQIKLQFIAEQEINNILLDKQIIEKIILNLLSNALKFTPVGGSIIVKLNKQGERINLMVSDTGTGIPKAQLPIIFERFRQVDSSITRVHEGTGIGLAVVKQLVELMQGNISVDSEPGEGTTFIIDLPAHFSFQPLPETTRPTDTAAVRLFKAGFSRNQESNPIASLQPKSNRPLVVIADDNYDIQAYIISLLKDKFEVITTDNGQLALEAIHQYRPQVILSDVMMPVMDGYQLTKTLKANPDTRNIPVILITAKVGKEALISNLDAGADDYLAKPFTAEELIARTCSAYNHYQDYLTNCKLNSQLVSIARRAGMADIAASTLHNIGNVLNSVHVTLDVLKESTGQAYPDHLTAVSSMIKDHQDNLASYFRDDPKGKILPDYLLALGKKISDEYTKITKEIKYLHEQIAHMEDIVAMQKTISGMPEVIEKFFLADIINNAIAVCRSSLDKVNIHIEQEVQDNLFIMTDKTKLLQILINLIQNASDALIALEGSISRKLIRIIVKNHLPTKTVSIIVQDNGIGIDEEYHNKIFNFGFTTKTHGHGFGLHTSALAAKELGGALRMKSKGPGHGAEFILTIPLKQVKRRRLDDSYEQRENSHY